MLFVGLSLLALELVVPSAGVLGILACVTLLAAVAAGFSFAGLAGGTLFMALTVVLIPLVIVLALKMWQSTAIGRRLLMEPPDEIDVLPAGRLVARDWIGRKGVALSPMLPAGVVRMDDQSFEAITEGLSVEKNDPVVVVAVRDNRLVVRYDDRSLLVNDNPSFPLASNEPMDLEVNRSASQGMPFSKAPFVTEASPSSVDDLRRPDVDLEVPDPFDDSLP